MLTRVRTRFGGPRSGPHWHAVYSWGVSSRTSKYTFLKHLTANKATAPHKYRPDHRRGPADVPGSVPEGYGIESEDDTRRPNGGGGSDVLHLVSTLHNMCWVIRTRLLARSWKGATYDTSKGLTHCLNV